ncbi:hypothetical protein LTS10_004670 [Elasticomyces elasticus]|nr:hypothetical protein LTS10_004670 [Elasticomyces elasticus]
MAEHDWAQGRKNVAKRILQTSTTHPSSAGGAHASSKPKRQYNEDGVEAVGGTKRSREADEQEQASASKKPRSGEVPRRYIGDARPGPTAIGVPTYDGDNKPLMGKSTRKVGPRGFTPQDNLRTERYAPTSNGTGTPRPNKGNTNIQNFPQAVDKRKVGTDVANGASVRDESYRGSKVLHNSTTGGSNERHDAPVSKRRKIEQTERPVGLKNDPIQDDDADDLEFLQANITPQPTHPGQASRDAEVVLAKATVPSMNVLLINRKAELGGSTAEVKSDPVDLTSDPEEVSSPSRIVISNERPPPPPARPDPPSRSTLLAPPRPRTVPKDYGLDSPFQRANSYMKSTKGRKPRAERNANRSSQGSSRAPSAMSSASGDAVVSQAAGSKAQPLTVDDGSQASVQPQPGVKQRRRITMRQDEADARLPMDLDKDMEEYVEETFRQRRLKQGSKNDHKGVNNVLGGIKVPQLPQTTQQRKSAQPIHGVQQVVPQRTEEHDGSFGNYLPAQQTTEHSERLNQKFTRDTASDEEKLRKPKATERMQKTSKPIKPRVNSVDESDSSEEDELHRDNNTISRTSRSLSPGKKQASVTSGVPPSDLPPTRFTESKKGKKSRKSDKAQNEGCNSWPILAFYSAMCCEDAGNGSISLKYNPHTQELELFRDMLPVPLLGTKRLASIRQADAQKMFHNLESGRVYITGSKTDISSGNICIAFEDHSGVEWLMRRLVLVTNDTVSIKDKDVDHLDKIFANQSAQSSEAFRIASLRIPVTKTSAQVLRKSSAPDTEDDEEHIQYDQPEVHSGTKRRDAMLAASIGKSSLQRTAVSKTQSRHFEKPDVATAPRRSTRDRKPVEERPRTPSPERWTRVNNPKPWSRAVEYPAHAARRVTVDFGDIDRLDEGQFLNDNLVTFGLRKIQEEMAPEYRDRTHFFNTFFYTSLSNKNGRKTFNYDSVKKWTKTVDIFQLPFVVVPINIDLHWFVAIICNLDALERKIKNEEFAYLDDNDDQEAQQALDGSVQITGSRSTSEQPRDNAKAMHKLSLVPNVGVSRDASVDNPASNSEVFEFGEDGKLAPSSTNGGSRPASEQPGETPSKLKTTKRKITPTGRKYPSDTPAIITLDSFGIAHTLETKFLKQYIMAEADEKRSMAVEYDTLQGVNAKGIPKQANFCDCGVYLLGYVEAFSRDPRGFVEKVLSREMEEESDFASFNPSAKRADIRNDLFKLNEEQEAQRREQKKAKAKGQKAEKPTSTMEEAGSVKEPAAPAVSWQPVENRTAKTPTRQDAAPNQGAPVASTRDSTTTSKTTPARAYPDVEESLPYEPPRALKQAHEPRMSTTQPVGGREHAAADDGDSSDGDSNDDEMLDNGNDQHRDVAHTAAHASHSDSLLDKVEASFNNKLANHSTQARKATSPPSSSDESSGPPSPGEEAEEDLARQRNQQPLTEDHRPAEIADSQEARHGSQKGQSRHTKFDD